MKRTNLKIIKENNFEIIKELEDICFDVSAYSLTQIEEMIESTNYILYSLEEEEEKKKIAYIILYDNSDSLEIIKVGVLPEYRKKQYGNILLDKAKEEKKEIFLEVRESNVVAIKFYENNLFEIVGRRKNYYTNPLENAIIMRWESC